MVVSGTGIVQSIRNISSSITPVKTALTLPHCPRYVHVASRRLKNITLCLFPLYDLHGIKGPEHVCSPHWMPYWRSV